MLGSNKTIKRLSRRSLVLDDSLQASLQTQFQMATNQVCSGTGISDAQQNGLLLLLTCYAQNILSGHDGKLDIARHVKSSFTSPIAQTKHDELIASLQSIWSKFDPYKETLNTSSIDDTSPGTVSELLASRFSGSAC
jgi:hypothetical protein